MSRKLKDWIDSYLIYTDNTEPPLNYKRWVAMSVIAGALQRKCRLEWGSLTFYPNLYVVLVGPPGKARKGTAMGPGKAMLEELPIQLSAEATTREALIRTVANSEQSVVNPVSMKEELHSSLTVFSPELTVFLGHQEYQMMSDLTDWFDCANNWRYNTKHKGVDDIKGVWVNLLGATTPDLIKTALPMDAIGGGLTSRIIFVYEPNKGKIVAVPFLTDEEKELRVKLIEDLKEINKLQGAFKVTKKFIDRWVDWYHLQAEQKPFEDPRFSGYIERRPLHLMKIAMICSASRTDSMIIDYEDFDRGLGFLEATERKMPRTFSGIGKNNNSDTMASLMAEIANKKDTTAGDLLRLYYYDVDQYTFESMLKTLAAMNYIDYTITGSFASNKIKYIGEVKHKV